MERDFKGVWIPKEIWLNTELSITDKVLLAEIDSLDNENHCTASNEYFAEFFDIGVATITRSIKKLKDLNLIETTMVNGPKGSYRLIKVIKGSNQNDETGLIKMINNYNSNNKTNNIVLSKDNTKTEDSFFNFSDEKPVKKNLYSKCLDLIYEFTNKPSLVSALIDYLKFRLEIKDKPLYGVNQFKGMLNSLSKVSTTTNDDLEDIVNYALQKGWLNFYPIPKGKQNNPDTNKAIQKKANPNDLAINEDGTLKQF